MRDASADSISQRRAIHRPVKEPQIQVQLVDQVVVESVNFFEAEAEQGGSEMVVKRTMTIDRFLPNAHPTAQ